MAPLPLDPLIYYDLKFWIRNLECPGVGKWAALATAVVDDWLVISVPDDDPTAGTGTPQYVERAAQWEALWRKINASADAHVRASADLEDFWKSRLDDVLEHVRKAHQALLPLFCDLADDLAAQAVVRYFDQYFTDNFATSTADGDEQK